MTNPLPRCAREGCPEPVYLGNAIALPSSIGALIVYVCAEHFALFLQRPVAPSKAGIVPAEALDGPRKEREP